VNTKTKKLERFSSSAIVFRQGVELMPKVGDGMKG
jgi:hypothetical protein